MERRTGRVGVAELVVKVLDRLLERLTRDLREVDLPLLLLHIPTLPERSRGEVRARRAEVAG